ncbi:MAG TPA: hypothetical protein VHQ02_07515 [Usitatibacter sp.]|nr:hypothetical protein [Usitatibacter sp.]
MKTRSLSSLAGALFAIVAALVLSSCGGGGASGDAGNLGGSIAILPNSGTIFAGVPFTFQISGGRKPYSLTSDQPGVLSLPSQIDSNSVEVVAANPGVIDAGLAPTDLPVRTVNITARSGDGQVATATVKVAQNFLTGYGIAFSPVTCPVANALGAQACAGGETALRFAAVFNGDLFGNRQFRLDVIKGPFQFVFPQGGNGSSVVVQSDHTGQVTAIIQSTGGVPTQLAVLRLTDIATGVSTDFVFTITGTSNGGVLTAIPSTITFTGNLTTDCGTGQSSFFVFDGSPPFNALSSNPAINVNSSSSTNPGLFTVSVGLTAPPCPTGTIIVTDSAGARATVDVKSVAGSGTPPTPPTFVVAPTAITLACGTSGSVTAVGGSGSYSTTSTSPLVTAAVSGSTVTITRAGPAGPGTGTMTSTVAVTDGSAIKTVDVTSPATCP